MPITASANYIMQLWKTRIHNNKTYIINVVLVTNIINVTRSLLYSRKFNNIFICID